MQRPWFKRKLYSWGWVPSSWQGWLLTVVYGAVIVTATLTIDENSPSNEIIFTFALPVVLSTIAFIRIAYKTGETPRWQRGCDTKHDDKPGPIDPA